MRLAIIGCGGVASYLAPVLVKSFIPENFLFVDGDVLEERNLDRQLFRPEQIGINKAAALAQLVDPKGDFSSVDERYFTPGSIEFPQGGIILVLVDNHVARKAALEAADAFRLTAILGMNEYEESQAILYHPYMAGTKADPRVRYPDILTDQRDDPTRPRGCTGEVLQVYPQLALANAMAAQLVLSHLWWWTVTRPKLDREIAREYAPIEHIWGAGTLTTKTYKEIMQ